MSEEPFISVIVPVYNGARYIERCLDALRASRYTAFEIIVVDDCSTDDTLNIVQKKGVNVLKLQCQSGSAFARNYGAKHASGDILLFIDSDVIVRPETLSLIIEDFKKNPDIVALFGSYDDEPEDKGFISQYKNLFHHFHHQTSDKESSSFWAGCGAIVKRVFEEVGGFDHERYKRPSIEDIELGYRIYKRGYRIILDKDLKVKHLKEWKFLSMVRTDIFQRAVPWSRLIMEIKFIPRELNLKTSHRVSSICIALIVLTIPFLFMDKTIFFDIPLTFLARVSSLILFIVFFYLIGESMPSLSGKGDYCL